MTGSKNVKRNAVPRNPVKHDIIRGASYTRRIRFRSRNCSGNPFRDKDTCSQVFLRSAASVESTKREKEKSIAGSVVGIINSIVFTLVGTSGHAVVAKSTLRRRGFRL